MQQIRLSDRQALAAALARQAVANQAQNHKAENVAALAVENLVLRLGQQHGIDNALQIMADICRAMAVWTISREHRANVTKQINCEHP